MPVATLQSRAQAVVERCAAIRWSAPRHDPAHVADAYGRWLSNLRLPARHVRWVADPAQPPAWRLSGDGVFDSWAAMAAADPARASTISLLLGSANGAASTRRRPVLPAEASIAAAWSLAVSAHISAVEAAWDAWLSAFETASANPVQVLAMALLCPGIPWAPPPMIACAARDALVACCDPDTWNALAGALARGRNEATAAGRHAPLDRGLPAQAELIEALIAVSGPIVEACEAGAFAHTILDQEIVVLAAPALFSDGRRAHRADGPALAWPHTRVYAWKGRVVPAQLILAPETVTPASIRTAPTERLQQSMIDIYAHVHGHRRCMQDMDARVTHEDHTGRLWRLHPGRMLRGEPGELKFVEVSNGTPEPDGSRKTYWLSVPPQMQTAQQAVAWTYGMTADDYAGLIVRT